MVGHGASGWSSWEDRGLVSLREVKERIRPLFTQQRVAVSRRACSWTVAPATRYEGEASLNGMADRRPALVARCAGSEDVVAALMFALMSWRPWR